MNRNQFINSICKNDSTTIIKLKQIIDNAIKEKDGVILNAKNTNRLTVVMDNFTYTHGKLVLSFKASNPLDGYVGSIGGKFTYDVPSNLSVEIPKLLLSLFSDLETVEFVVPFKKFIFTKPIVCNIKVDDAMKDKAKNMNLEYNIGFSGTNQEKLQNIDIENFGKRDGEKIDNLYVKVLPKMVNLEVNILDNFRITPLNTIMYKTNKDEIHITHSAMISKDKNDYKIIYDALDGSDTKDISKEYIYKNYLNKDTRVLLEVLKELK